MRKPEVNLRTFARRLVIAFGVVSVVFLGVLAVFQKNFIYYPSRASEASLLGLATQRGLMPWRAPEGHLIGWKTPLPNGNKPARRLLVFHGNGGQAVDRAYIAASLPADWEVFCLEYPGYGARAGSPSELAIREAALQGCDLLRESSPLPLFLAGESLGTGVASWVAAQRPDSLAGVVLITPMTSLVDVAAYHCPFLPVHLMMTERYDSVTALRRYQGPVAFVLAGRDEIIPVDLGRRLYQGYSGPKRIWEQRDASHNTLDFAPQHWAPVFQFVLDHAH